MCGQTYCLLFKLPTTSELHQKYLATSYNTATACKEVIYARNWLPKYNLEACYLEDTVEQHN